MPIHRRIIAHHLILTGYGFWLPNDPRGSGSTELRQTKFETLGPIHHSRKRTQPARNELRAFYKDATPKLDHTPIWFNENFRALLANAFAEVIQSRNYTVWECFIGSNHAHMCIRNHRDKYETMWQHLTTNARNSAINAGLAPAVHPLWADRPYSKYCYVPADIHRTIGYIRENAAKEGLSPQTWPFVRPYDGWPLHKG